MAGPATVHAGYVLLAVRLTPNARDERIETVKILADGKAVLQVRVRAVPEGGAANRALEGLVAKALKIARSRVSITSGHTQRIKTVKIEGDGAATLKALGIDA